MLGLPFKALYGLGPEYVRDGPEIGNLANPLRSLVKTNAVVYESGTGSSKKQDLLGSGTKL